MKAETAVRLCVPVCAETVTALQGAARQAAEVADLIELRLDCLSPIELEKFKRWIDEVPGAFLRPIILTLRSAGQGGRGELSSWERRSFWTALLESRVALMDLELDLVSELSSGKDMTAAAPDWSRIICSHHDFDRVSPDIEAIYERLASTPARVIKIAVQAHDVIDCLAVFRLLARARREGREVIAIAMGDAGVATRILGPAHGAALTYGALDDESATAPGQVTARDLRSVYRIHQIDRETVITGLIGLPVTHSVSPLMHNAAFESAQLNGVYLPLEVHDVGIFFQRMVHPRTREIDWNLRGLSVTAPHKSRVMDFLDWIEPRAKEIGAVNTVVVEADKLLGYNTDAEGLIRPLLRKMDSLHNTQIAVIGAGGAASAAVWACQQHGARVTLFARDQEKGTRLSERFGVSCNEVAAAPFRDFDVVINATPLGSFGPLVAETPASAEQLQGARLVYDLVYNPSETRFLQEARKSGCETLEGIEMLVVQAGLQFELWTGKTPSSSIMYTAAAKRL